MAASPTKFIREVRSEMSRVTWPTRKETLVTTGLVIVMVIVMALFFFAIDEVLSFAVSAIFSAAG